METEQNQNQNAGGTNPSPAPQAPAPAATDNSTLMGVLAYIGILVIIPFLMAKDNPFVKFHIKQGIVLVVIEVALWVIGMMIYGLWIIIPLLNLALVVLSIIGIVNVVQKKEAELPVVGQFAKHVNI